MFCTSMEENHRGHFHILFKVMLKTCGERAEFECAGERRLFLRA